MVLTHLKPESYATWKEYYWSYQNKLAELHYIPLFQKWGISMAGKKVLDVGCGDGGFTAGIAEAGAICTGVEIRDFGWERTHPNLRFVQQDIFADNAQLVLGDDYDIIILRDVIEHISLENKSQFMAALRKFTSNKGIILMTFPPFYSPFGLHQQTFLKSILKKVPYLGWIPGSILDMLLSMLGESDKARADVKEIRECRMTLRRFKKMVGQLDYNIDEEKYYLVRPSHELRYGWKLRESRLGGIPLIREVFILGSVFKLSIAQDGPV
jgi:SAM-dependent methyltransferase